MKDNIQDLKRMAESYGLEFSDKGNGHIQLSNHGFMVNYWPESKKQTVHAGGKTHTRCSNYDAVKICLDGAKIGAKPDKSRIRKNPATGDFKPKVSENPRPQHLYSGDKPPWEYPSMIRCWSDIWRSEAHELQQKAANLECADAYQDAISTPLTQKGN